MIDVSIGGCFGSALDKEGIIWTWGSNSSGELGLGDFEARPHPFPVTHIKGKMVHSLAAGGSFCFAIGDVK